MISTANEDAPATPSPVRAGIGLAISHHHAVAGCWLVCTAILHDEPAGRVNPLKTSIQCPTRARVRARRCKGSQGGTPPTTRQGRLTQKIPPPMGEVVVRAGLTLPNRHCVRAAILMSRLDRHIPGLVVRTAAITNCPPIKPALRWPEPMALRTKGLRHPRKRRAICIASILPPPHYPTQRNPTQPCTCGAPLSLEAGSDDAGGLLPGRTTACVV